MKWSGESSTDLINHIGDSYNKYLEKEISELSRLTTIILKVHGSEHKELSKVHRIYHIIQINLVQHILKEQTGIFPLVKMYDRKPSKELLDEMFESINELTPFINETKELLDELRNVTDNYTAPEDGCVTYDNTYEKLAKFESKILEKLTLEENVLFPKLKEELSKY